MADAIDPNLLLLGIALLALIAIALIVFIKRLKTGGPSTKEMNELYEHFESLIKRKAKYAARISVLSEAKEYGRISEKQYVEEVRRNKEHLEHVNRELDDVVNRLAMPHYKHQLKQEESMEKEKINYLIKLQEDKKDLQTKLEQSQELVEGTKRRNDLLEAESKDIKTKLDAIEGKYKGGTLDFENKLDEARKKLEQANENLDRVIKENVDLKEQLGMTSTEAQELKKKAWKQERALLKAGASAEEGKKALESGEDLRESLEKSKEKMQEYYDEVAFYSLLVNRYATHIETSEAKTIQDLKSLIQPQNKQVLAAVDRVLAGFPEYNPDRDVLAACERAYAFVSDEIHSVPSTGVTFWMTIKDMIEHKIADYEDKAILLCSILLSMDVRSKVMIVDMADGSNRPLVLLEHKRSFVLCDVNKRHDFLAYVGASQDEAISKYTYNGLKVKRTLYEFDNKKYKQY